MGAARKRPCCSSRRLPPSILPQTLITSAVVSYMTIKSHVRLLVSAWDLPGWSARPPKKTHSGSNDFFPTGNSLRHSTNWLYVNERFHRLVLECAWLRTEVGKESWCSHRKHQHDFQITRRRMDGKEMSLYCLIFFLLFSQPDAGYNEFYQMWGQRMATHTLQHFRHAWLL